MKNIELYKLMDLVDEIKKIDAIILLHKNVESNEFMASQYEAKKVKLMAQLIDALAAPKVQSEQSFSLIQMLLSKFYPNKVDKQAFKETGLDDLIAVI
ncbi:hypothetical protein [Sphingobacterium sp. DR205]|uniref:hypothetical protein n=1 Tax=Sphingobacterium sp. DR205 TaxID=2713573 RepID=UPI0013E521B2|nr:hypothetical protein [Sphingobacterium sp. DR205]QIH31630.1 hypothetical protein G6053_01330 [Sphingobacterium sp. DR205]